jgi:hypothetical protein
MTAPCSRLSSYAFAALFVVACSSAHHPAELGDSNFPGDAGQSDRGAPPVATNDAGGGPSGDAAPPADDAAADDAAADDAAADAPTEPPPEAGLMPDGAPVVLSNQCTMGTISVVSDIVNPGDVYLDGTLEEGACGRDALTHFSDPNTACLGFDCALIGMGAMIRPTDGRLLYTENGLLREFHEEICLHPSPQLGYPTNPIANDTLIPTPMCDPVVTHGVLEFQVSPEGDVYYSCNNGGSLPAWYTLSGTKVYDPTDSSTLRHVGRNKLALVSDASFNLKLVDLSTGAGTSVVPTIVTSTVIAIRARDAGGFWAAVGGTNDSADLWQIDPSGQATKTGSYPAVPAGVTAGDGKLDGCGALLQMGSDGGPAFHDVIVRRELPATSAVVYTEANNPAVKIHASYLITGP